MKERNDYYEQLNTNDREDVEELLGRFGANKPHSSPDLHEQCSLIAEAAAKMSGRVLSCFCSAVGVSENSEVFKQARIAGDRAYEWEISELQSDWLISYLLADVDDVEFEEMMKVAAASRLGSFNANMHALLVLRAKWRSNAASPLRWAWPDNT